MRALSGLIILLWAVGAWAFTDATLREDCNSTENPLSHGGQWSQPLINTDPSRVESLGGVCSRTSTTGDGSMWWNVQTFGPDTAVSATLPDATGSSTNRVTLYLRVNAPNSATTTAYFCGFEADTPLIRLSRLDNGTTFVTLTTDATVDLANGHQIGCEMIGSSLKAWVNTGSGWVNPVSFTDATYSAAGYVGLRINTTGYTFDDLGFQTITVGGPTVGRTAILPMVQ